MRRLFCLTLALLALGGTAPLPAHTTGPHGLTSVQSDHVHFTPPATNEAAAPGERSGLTRSWELTAANVPALPATTPRDESVRMSPLALSFLFLLLVLLGRRRGTGRA